jgi:hypothetical protein
MSPASALRASALLAGLMLSGCSHPISFEGTGVSTASAGTRAACRQRADEVYSRQNRADIYRDDNFAANKRDTPFATTSVLGEPTRALSARYGREQLLDECMRGSAGNIGTATDAPDPTSAATPAPATRAPASAKPGTR